MRIDILKTFEISENQWREIAVGFKESFNLEVSEKTIKDGFFIKNRLGYGYHALAYSDEGKLMGYNVFSPVFYKNNIKCAVSGSTFVKKEYRSNLLIFRDMMLALRKAVIDDGFDIEVGVPNANSRQYASKILKCKYICDLNYYILPLHPLKCLKQNTNSFIESFFSFFFIIHVYIQWLSSYVLNYREKDAKYEMEDSEESLSARFKGNKYKLYIEGNIHAYYLICDENGINTAYIMDFREGEKRTSFSLAMITKHIISEEKVDAILFVGLLKLNQFTLIKVPKRFIPKKLALTYYVLNKKDNWKYEGIESPGNWKFSLMSFDVR